MAPAAAEAVCHVEDKSIAQLWLQARPPAAQIDGAVAALQSQKAVSAYL